MINDSAGIVENALLEASLRRIRLIESMDSPDIATDEEYDNRILDVIYGRTKEKKRLPKRIALILVAALTICFLIVFTVSAQVRTAVVDFFVEVYETFASFFIEDNDINECPNTLLTEYRASYLEANNYQIIKQIKSEFNILSVWSQNNISVYFSQYIIETNDVFLDIEDTSYEVSYIGEQKIYYKIKNNIYTVKWLTYGYSFNLRCDESLGWEEIEKIITSLEPVTE